MIVDSVCSHSLLIATPVRALKPMKIQDNSFPIEEAYNQEPGVYQYIEAFIIDDGDSLFTSTNEKLVGSPISLRCQ